MLVKLVGINLHAAEDLVTVRDLALKDLALQAHILVTPKVLLFSLKKLLPVGVILKLPVISWK